MTLKLGLVTYQRPTSGEKFVMPRWASCPNNGVALHVTKDGSTMTTLKLDDGAKYYMFGRAPKTCESGSGFTISHLSLSRQHAVVVHGENDSLYIIDLESANGTFVNQERLVPYTPQLLENGNIITFGESTRKYVVRVFSKDDRLMDVSESVSLSIPCRFAGLSVSTGDDMDFDDEDDDDEDNSSPSSKKEGERRRMSLLQARIFSTLNARVSYPSPKSLQGRKPGDSPVSPSASAAAVAATASPCASPMTSSFKRYDGSPMQEEVKGYESESDNGSLPASFPPLAALPPAACPSFGHRSRSLSMSVSPHSSRGENIEEVNSSNMDSLVRFRSNSTSAALVKKRPAPFPLNPPGVVRRRSVVERRRVSFCASPEFIGPRTCIDSDNVLSSIRSSQCCGYPESSKVSHVQAPMTPSGRAIGFALPDSEKSPSDLYPVRPPTPMGRRSNAT